MVFDFELCLFGLIVMLEISGQKSDLKIVLICDRFHDGTKIDKIL